MAERILVMGARGVVGQNVLRRLQLLGMDAVGASREGQGEGWVRLDLLDPGSHAPALRDVSRVMLISRPGDEAADRYARPLVEAMCAQGVSRVAVLSALGAEKRPDFSLRKVELLVERSGLEWCHVRPNFFMQMLAQPPLASEIALQGRLSLPLGDAKVAYVEADDVAAVLCKALIDPACAGQAIEVNGPEALDHHEILRRISAQLRRPLDYNPIDEATARELMQSRGFPEAHIERVMRFYALVRAGWCSNVDEAVATLLGRELKRLDAFIAENADAWQAQAPLR